MAVLRSKRQISKPVEYSLTAGSYSDDEIVADVPEGNE